MVAKQWTLISQTITDHIKIPSTATNTNITRLLNNANKDWTSIAEIINKYEVKNGTQDSVIKRILDIKNGKITELSQITGGSAQASSGGGGSSSSTGTGEENNSGNTGSSGTVKKVPITDPEEAMDFALREWNKIRRTSGHTLECQVFGSNHWMVGEWCKVYIPSLNEYIDMYISKVDHSNDSGSEWLTNITLMDYAPQLSEPEEEEEEENTSNQGQNQNTEEEANSGSGEWTEIAKILQENYEADDWNSFIQSVKDAKTWDEIKNAVTSHTKKSDKWHNDIIQDLCKVKTTNKVTY